MVQNFYVSADGSKVYWELYEIKGMRGYESFLDALNGNQTLYPLYFPRIVTIDLAASKLSPVLALGQGKYFLRRDFTSQYDKSERSITYIGHDEDYKKLWLGKLMIP